MIGDIDILGLWDMFVAGMNKIMAWLAYVLGGKDFDSDYGQKG